MTERKTYREKLLDPRWQRRRLEILQAADFTCLDCGRKDRTLHVHHQRYLPNREPWEYPDELLRCVCEVCHTAHGDVAAQISDGIGELRRQSSLLSLKGKLSLSRVIGALTTQIEQSGERAVMGLLGLQMKVLFNTIEGDGPTLRELLEKYAAEEEAAWQIHQRIYPDWPADPVAEGDEG